MFVKRLITGVTFLQNNECGTEIVLRQFRGLLTFHVSWSKIMDSVFTKLDLNTGLMHDSTGPTTYVIWKLCSGSTSIICSMYQTEVYIITLYEVYPPVVSDVLFLFIYISGSFSQLYDLNPFKELQKSGLHSY